MLTESWQSVRRILAVRLDNIGDVVLLAPSLRAIKENLPRASITLLASPAGSQVAPLLPWIDDVLVERVVWQDASGKMAQDAERELKLVEKIRAGNFDAALIFTSFSQSPYPPAYICYLAGIPIRVGQSKEFGGSLLSNWIKPLPDATHQAERNLHLLESIGLEVARRDLELRVPPDSEAAADALLRRIRVSSDKPLIVLAPGASCAARRYDPMRFAIVARELSALGLPVVVIGSERERELVAPIVAQNANFTVAENGNQTVVKNLNAVIAETANRIIADNANAVVYENPRGKIVSIVGETSLPVMSAIIKRASLVIANDSGPMHVADALRRPMLILFSGTEIEEQWRPRSAPAVLLRRPTECAPCYHFTCPYQMECLDISPDKVIKEAQAILARAGVRLSSVENIKEMLADSAHRPEEKDLCVGYAF